MQNIDMAKALDYAKNLIMNEGDPFGKTKGRYFCYGNIAIKVGEIENITPKGSKE